MAKRKAKKASKSKPAPKKTPKKKKGPAPGGTKAAAKTKAKKKTTKGAKATAKGTGTAKGTVVKKGKKTAKPAAAKAKPAPKKKAAPKAALKPPLRKPAKSAPAAKPAPESTRSAGTMLMIPPPLLNSDFLPLWFGGDGLTECFTKLGVATIGELRQKTEEDVLEAGGTSALVRIKARIERIEERALAPKMEPPSLAASPPMSETFAYFLKSALPEQSMLGTPSGRTQVCDIVLRPSSTQVTVRVCGGAAGGWREVTVPLDALELVSRDHRREELEDASDEELNELTLIYKLKDIEPVVRVDAILDFEFSAFGREW